MVESDQTDAAIEAVDGLEGSNATITHTRSTSYGRHEFEYDGAVHAQHLDDGWEFTGLGSGWFSIRRTYE